MQAGCASSAASDCTLQLQKSSVMSWSSKGREGLGRVCCLNLLMIWTFHNKIFISNLESALMTSKQLLIFTGVWLQDNLGRSENKGLQRVQNLPVQLQKARSVACKESEDRWLRLLLPSSHRRRMQQAELQAGELSSQRETRSDAERGLRPLHIVTQGESLYWAWSTST